MTTEAPPAAVLAYLSSCARTDASGATVFHDETYGLHLASDREGCPPRSAREVADWTRTNRPELWGQPETKAAAPTSTTAADVMARVRAGDLSADEATKRILAIGATATTSAPSRAAVATDARAPAPTMTEMMAAVRRGVPGAQARLEAAMKEII